MIAAADGNPLLALESARAARAATRPAARCGRWCARRSPASTSAARRTAELAAVAGRDLDRAELAALADAGRRSSRRATAACSAAPTAASASATRCCATPSTPTSTTPAAAPITRPLGQALATRRRVRPPPRPRAGRDDLAARPAGRGRARCRRARRRWPRPRPSCSEAVELDPSAEPRPRAGRHAGRSSATARGSRDAFEHARPHTGRRPRCAPRSGSRSSLCDPTSALEAARRGLARRGRRPRHTGRAAADPRVGRGRDDRRGRRLRDAHRGRGARRRSRATTRCGRHHIENVRGFIALAEGRLEEAEAQLVASGEAGERAGRADLAYGGWANAAVRRGGRRRARAGAGPRRARRRAGHGGLPVIEFQLTGLRAARARAARPPRRGARGQPTPGGAGRPARARPSCAR